MLQTLDSGVLGAALLGLVAAGLEADLQQAAARRVKVAQEIEPLRSAQPRLDELYGTYREAYVALETVFSRLAAAPPARSLA